MATILINKEGFVTVADSRGYNEIEEIPSEVTIDILKAEYIGLAKGSSLLGFAYPQYTRRLVLTGKLRAIKIVVKGSLKWFIELKSIDNYKEKVARSNRLRNYTLRIRKDFESTVRKALDKLDIEYELEIAFVSEDNEG